MFQKNLSFIVGALTSLTAWDLWNSVLTAMAVAFVGGLVTFGTKEFLDYLKRLYRNRKTRAK